MKTLFSIFVILMICNAQQKRSINEHAVMATLYQQSAAEVRALQYQAFNFASLSLDQLIKAPTLKKYAVVVDIDETLLDNSPYQAKSILDNISYPDQWDEWCNLANAKPIPGAISFLNEAVKKGVDIFYISNRKTTVEEATMKNLSALGFPQIIKSHFFLRTSDSDKTSRRNLVEKTHEIIMLIGDNLTDFSAIFARKSISERANTVDKFHSEFGKRFVILPNSTYGEWEGALYRYNYRLTSEEKNNKRKQALVKF